MIFDQSEQKPSVADFASTERSLKGSKHPFQFTSIHYTPSRHLLPYSSPTHPSPFSFIKKRKSSSINFSFLYGDWDLNCKELQMINSTNIAWILIAIGKNKINLYDYWIIGVWHSIKKIMYFILKFTIISGRSWLYFVHYRRHLQQKFVGL